MWLGRMLHLPFEGRLEVAVAGFDPLSLVVRLEVLEVVPLEVGFDLEVVEGRELQPNLGQLSYRIGCGLTCVE